MAFNFLKTMLIWLFFTSKKSVFNRLGGVAGIKDAIEASPVAKKTATTIRLNCAPVTGVKVLPTISNHETKEAPSMTYIYALI